MRILAGYVHKKENIVQYPTKKLRQIFLAQFVIILLLAEFLLQNTFQGRLTDLLQFIADTLHRFLHLEHAGEVDGCGGDHKIDIGFVNGLFKVFDHVIAIAHGREDRAGVGIFLVGCQDGSDSIGARINDLGSAEAAGSHPAGAVSHLTVGEGRAVFDDQDTFATDGFGIIHEERGGSFDHDRIGIELVQGSTHFHDGFGVGSVHFVDDEYIGSTDVGLTRVVSFLVTGAVRVGNNDLQVGDIEREVIIPAIPEDDIHFLFSLAQDGFIIDTGIDDHAIIDVGFVFFTFLDRALMLVEVGIGGKALHLLLDQVTVGHGVANGGHFVSQVTQDQRNTAGGLGFT